MISLLVAVSMVVGALCWELVKFTVREAEARRRAQAGDMYWREEEKQ